MAAPTNWCSSSWEQASPAFMPLPRPLLSMINASFVGRRPEIERLRRAYIERSHVLIVGLPGIGKTALLRFVQSQLSLFLCEETSGLRRICESFERHLGWTHRNLNLVERKNRLLPYVARRAQPVALDSVALTPPRVARFMHDLMERTPVWIACRSAYSKEIGAVWQYLTRFESIQVPRLAPSETAAMARFAVTAGRIAVSALSYTRQLHRIAGGNPRAIEELLVELSAREYRLENAFDRKLLGLDRRIHSAAEIIAAP